MPIWAKLLRSGHLFEVPIVSAIERLHCTYFQVWKLNCRRFLFPHRKLHPVLPQSILVLFSLVNSFKPSYKYLKQSCWREKCTVNFFINVFSLDVVVADNCARLCWYYFNVSINFTWFFKLANFLLRRLLPPTFVLSLLVWNKSQSRKSYEPGTKRNSDFS